MVAQTEPSKPRAKPQRLIRLALPPEGGRPGVVRIMVGRTVVDYHLRPLPADSGLGFALEKIGAGGGEVYHVLLDLEEGKHSCECKGHLRWQTPCKHIAGLLALRERGLL
jgi:hypothetical protein